MTLTDFLLARIDEDVAVARESKPGPWAWKPYRASGEMLQSAEDSAHTSVLRTDNGWAPLPADAEHIARHDPARVLAECEAKRRIVGHHQYGMGSRIVWPGVTEEAYEVCSACYERSDDGYASNAKAPCMTLRLLALPFADHPDYDEAWRL